MSTFGVPAEYWNEYSTLLRQVCGHYFGTRGGLSHLPRDPELKLHGFHALRLMRVCVTHRNKVLTHHELLQAVWGCLRLFVNQLHRKTEPNTPASG